jgi:ABC-type sulfate transport system permease component
MSFSALEGRYNDTVYIDLIEALDPDENPWTVAIVDLMRVGEVADGLYMAAVFAPGRLIHRAAPVWSLEEARALADRFFAEIIAGTFVPIPYAIKPLEPIIESDDEE